MVTLSRTAERLRSWSLAVTSTSSFSAKPKSANVVLSDKTLENVKISKPQKAIEVQGELNPGQNVDFKVSLDNINLQFSQLDKIEKAEIDVMDVQTKETETINFVRKDGLLTASVPTKEVQTSFHWDVLALIA